MAVGALAAVAAVVVVIVVASGGSDGESNACAALDGVVTPTDVDSILGEPAAQTATEGEGHFCNFETDDGDVIVSLGLSRADSEGFASFRATYEEEAGVEDLSAVGDDAFYSSPGDPEARVPTVVVLRGAVIVTVQYIGDREDEIREPLIELATLVVDRLPPDVDIPD